MYIVPVRKKVARGVRWLDCGFGRAGGVGFGFLGLMGGFVLVVDVDVDVDVDFEGVLD